MSLTAQPNLGSGILREVDLRRARRYSDKGSMIQASWIDADGNVNVGMVKVINISEGGLALELPVIPQQTAMVRIQSDRHKLAGTAAVRHVTAQGSRCVVGLEFANGMRWQPPWERGEGPQELSRPTDAPVRSTVTKTVGLTGVPVPVRPRPAEVRPAAAPAGPEVSPRPETATGEAGKPGEAKRLNGAVPLLPAKDHEAATAAGRVAEKASERPAGANQETAGHTSTPAASIEAAGGNPAKAPAKVAVAEEAKPAEVKATDAAIAKLAEAVNGKAPSVEAKLGTKLAETLTAKPAEPTGAPSVPAVTVEAKPGNAGEQNGQETAPKPAETPAAVKPASADATLEAEPKKTEPAAQKAQETLPAAMPEAPAESKADDLADFWGWAKQ